MWRLGLYRKTSGHGMNHQPLAVLTENEYCMIITSRFSNHSGRIEAIAKHGGAWIAQDQIIWTTWWSYAWMA